MSIQITGQDGQILGFAARVLDFTEPDPVTITPLGRGFSRISMPHLPIRIGHVRGNVLDAAAIHTNGKVIEPRGDEYLDAECRACDSALVICPNQEPGRTWFVIEHEHHCAAFAAMLAGELAGDEP